MSTLMNNINTSIRTHEPFPQKLMSILSRKEFEDIISWMPEGKSFSIHNKNGFSSVLKSLNLQETKFDSFRRKLHRWGFKVVKKGTKDAVEYYHKFFLRDDPILCSSMKSCTDKRRKGMALENRDNNQSKSVNFNEIPRNSFEISTPSNHGNHLQSIHFAKNSEVKQQNNSFDQYVELKHNEYWLKRKHLIQKYYIYFAGNQVAPIQLYEKSSNMPRFHDFSDKFPTTCNVNSAMCIKRRRDVLEEKNERLALKKRIKNRKDKDTLVCKKKFDQIGMREEILFHCKIDKIGNSINAYAA